MRVWTDLTVYTPEVVDKEICIKYGSFSSEKSASFKKVNGSTEFKFFRSDLFYSFGYWGTDVIKLDGLEIKDMYFAYANETNNDIGILGLGKLDAFLYWGNTYYPNLPEILIDKGMTNTSAYSLYFDPNSNSGTVLFGAVDLSKYSGPLKTLPILDVHFKPLGIGILLSGVYFSDGVDVGIIGNYTFAPIIDTFSTLSS